MSVITTSGFFINEIRGNLRPPGQITQWTIDAEDPSSLRHWESGQYKTFAKQGIRDGFTAQQESGVAINFGQSIVDDNGFNTDTVALTLNFGEVNSHDDGFFNIASGIGTNFKGFNIQLWSHSLSAFNVIPTSGNPIFYFLTSSGWQRGLKLNTGTPGIQKLPKSAPSGQNISTNSQNQTFISGVYKPTEFSHYVYIFAQFPSGQYILGTYGGLGVGDFTFRWTYDWTDIGANVLASDTQDRQFRTGID